MVKRLLGMLALILFAMPAVPGGAPPKVQFHASTRCVACHNGLRSPAGEDVSIGHDWSASVMANSSRDPYWQASVRRETLDHPQASSQIQDECAACHMPMTRYRARVEGRPGEVFAHLAAPPADEARREALDGVSCSVCHQISPEGLGAEASWNGHFDIAPPHEGTSAEFGPYEIEPGLQRIMRSSTGLFEPQRSEHVRRSELCASCHTLRTQALDAAGRVIGSLPEQMPFQEWRHSRYVNERSCQDCHMPRSDAPVAISRVLGEQRPELARHVFVGGNFFLQRMLARYREAQSVAASSLLLEAAASRTVDFLATHAATLALVTKLEGSRLRATVRVANLGGHKLPTAYPSRRAWLHLRVRDAAGATLFESGALRPDGAIEGNDNDADARRFEPHYRQIDEPGEVEIYESILGTADGALTTALLSATHYLKDNRVLPAGFDKQTAGADIAVVGEAKDDPRFDAGGHEVDYLVDLPTSRGPFTVEAELLYQPIGYRWAHNLAAYDAPEPRRFVGYYEALQGASATVLASAGAAVR